MKGIRYRVSRGPRCLCLCLFSLVRRFLGWRMFVVSPSPCLGTQMLVFRPASGGLSHHTDRGSIKVRPIQSCNCHYTCRSSSRRSSSDTSGAVVLKIWPIINRPFSYSVSHATAVSLQPYLGPVNEYLVRNLAVFKVEDIIHYLMKVDQATKQYFKWKNGLPLVVLARLRNEFPAKKQVRSVMQDGKTAHKVARGMKYVPSRSCLLPLHVRFPQSPHLWLVTFPSPALGIGH